MKNQQFKLFAIWAVTPKGAQLAGKIAAYFPGSDMFLSESLEIRDIPHIAFLRLSDAVSRNFSRYDGHIFIMSTGIVVRMIAPYIRHKTSDPAVVVMDEAGQFVISLLSGHIGGANALARQIAESVGAVPVITTATDINQVPAIDMIAKEKGLFIENPEAIRYVNMALLTGKPVRIHDPFDLIAIPDGDGECGVFVDDVVADLPPNTLILRPKSLIAGMGCNRNTDKAEMKELLFEVFQKFQLSPNSLSGIASIELKKDEAGLIALAEELNVPMYFFSKEELEIVKNIKNPSEMVKKHIGIGSVCEAAAILASDHGDLIVPKHSTKNATIAIARKHQTSCDCRSLSDFT